MNAIIHIKILKLFFKGINGIEEARLRMKNFLFWGFVIFLVSSIAGISSDLRPPFSLVGEIEKLKSLLPSVDTIERG